MTEITFTSSISRPDGRVISCSIKAPADRPDVGELGELAQMTAHRGNSLIDSNDAAIARRCEQEVPF